MTDKRYCPQCGEECSWEDRFCCACRAELRTTPSRRSSGPHSDRNAANPLDALASTPTEMGFPAGSMLADRYKIIRELGAGGMGRVYMAEDQKLGISVAIKVLRDILKQDPGSVRRLVSEAKASIMLAHPNIVRLHNFEDRETAKFLVMEYVEGETLAYKIAREGKITEEETRRLAIEICKALEHAHSKKVIHRDLKPGNVLLGKDGSVKLADFGIARVCRDSVSRLTSQQDSGTLLYMSPEQLDGESREASDIYSFGIMLYEMLAGDPPFVTGEITAQIRYKPPKEIEGLSPEARSIVMKCLEKKPENRFASVRELREELDGTARQRRMSLSETTRRLESLKTDGSKASEEGRYADAIELWNQVLALKPDDAEAMESARRAQQQLARAEETARLNQVALQEEAARLKEIAAQEETARLQKIAAQEEAERRETERLRAEEVKKWLDDVILRANGMMHDGGYREAQSFLRQAREHFPNDPRLTECLARADELARTQQIDQTPTVRTAPPRSRSWKKILLFSMIGVSLVVLAAVVVPELFDSGGVISYPPPEPPEKVTGSTPDPPPDTIPNPEPTPSAGKFSKPANTAPSEKIPYSRPEATGKEKISSEPPETRYEPPPYTPPPPPVPSLSGSWVYSVAPTNANGQMQISGSDSQLQLDCMADYIGLGIDGFSHRFREQYVFEGSLNGNVLVAICRRGTYQVDGIFLQPPLPAQITLQVSPDRRFMNGSVQNRLGVGTVVARRQ